MAPLQDGTDTAKASAAGRLHAAKSPDSVSGRGKAGLMVQGSGAKQHPPSNRLSAPGLQGIGLQPRPSVDRTSPAPGSLGDCGFRPGSSPAAPGVGSGPQPSPASNSRRPAHDTADSGPAATAAAPIIASPTKDTSTPHTTTKNTPKPTTGTAPARPTKPSTAATKRKPPTSKPGVTTRTSTPSAAQAPTTDSALPPAGESVIPVSHAAALPLEPILEMSGELERTNSSKASLLQAAAAGQQGQQLTADGAAGEQQQVVTHPEDGATGGKADPQAQSVGLELDGRLFQLGRRLGSGSFATVYLARWLPAPPSSASVSQSQEGDMSVSASGVFTAPGARRCVVKKIDRGQSDTEEVMNEIEVMKRAGFHPNLVHFQGWYRDPSDQALCLVMGFCEGGTLAGVLQGKPGSTGWQDPTCYFPESVVMTWFVQLLMALSHLHARQIIHRDLKPENIFLTRNLKVIKLGDLGIAKKLEGSLELAITCLGTPYYMSPEVIAARPYTYASDMWSLGCVLYEMAARRPAFEALGLPQLMFKIMRTAYEPLPTIFSRPFQQLVTCLLRADPDDRPTTQELLQMPFVRKHLQQLMGQRVAPAGSVSISALDAQTAIRRLAGHSGSTTRASANTSASAAMQSAARPASSNKTPVPRRKSKDGQGDPLLRAPSLQPQASVTTLSRPVSAGVQPTPVLSPPTPQARPGSKTRPHRSVSGSSSLEAAPGLARARHQSSAQQAQRPESGVGASLVPADGAAPAQPGVKKTTKRAPSKKTSQRSGVAGSRGPGDVATEVVLVKHGKALVQDWDHGALYEAKLAKQAEQRFKARELEQRMTREQVRVWRKERDPEHQAKEAEIQALQQKMWEERHKQKASAAQHQLLVDALGEEAAAEGTLAAFQARDKLLRTPADADTDPWGKDTLFFGGAEDFQQASAIEDDMEGLLEEDFNALSTAAAAALQGGMSASLDTAQLLDTHEAELLLSEHTYSTLDPEHTQCDSLLATQAEQSFTQATPADQQVSATPLGNDPLSEASHVATLDVATAQPLAVTSGECGRGAAHWSQDGGDTEEQQTEQSEAPGLPSVEASGDDVLFGSAPWPPPGHDPATQQADLAASADNGLALDITELPAPTGTAAETSQHPAGSYSTCDDSASELGGDDTRQAMPAGDSDLELPAMVAADKQMADDASGDDSSEDGSGTLQGAEAEEDCGSGDECSTDASSGCSAADEEEQEEDQRSEASSQGDSSEPDSSDSEGADSVGDGLGVEGGDTGLVQWPASRPQATALPPRPGTAPAPVGARWGRYGARWTEQSGAAGRAGGSMAERATLRASVQDLQSQLAALWDTADDAGRRDVLGRIWQLTLQDGGDQLSDTPPTADAASVVMAGSDTAEVHQHDEAARGASRGGTRRGALTVQVRSQDWAESPEGNVGVCSRVHSHGDGLEQAAEAAVALDVTLGAGQLLTESFQQAAEALWQPRNQQTTVPEQPTSQASTQPAWQSAAHEFEFCGPPTIVRAVTEDVRGLEQPQATNMQTVAHMELNGTAADERPQLATPFVTTLSQPTITRRSSLTNPRSLPPLDSLRPSFTDLRSSSVTLNAVSPAGHTNLAGFDGGDSTSMQPALSSHNSYGGRIRLRPLSSPAHSAGGEAEHGGPTTADRAVHAPAGRRQQPGGSHPTSSSGRYSGHVDAVGCSSSLQPAYSGASSGPGLSRRASGPWMDLGQGPDQLFSGPRDQRYSSVQGSEAAGSLCPQRSSGGNISNPGSSRFQGVTRLLSRHTPDAQQPTLLPALSHRGSNTLVGPAGSGTGSQGVSSQSGGSDGSSRPASGQAAGAVLPAGLVRAVSPGGALRPSLRPDSPGRLAVCSQAHSHPGSPLRSASSSHQLHSDSVVAPPARGAHQVDTASQLGTGQQTGLQPSHSMHTAAVEDAQFALGPHAPATEAPTAVHTGGDAEVLEQALAKEVAAMKRWRMDRSRLVRKKDTDV